MEHLPPSDSEAYKSLARAWAASVTVVTGKRNSARGVPGRTELDGFTATAFLTVSITPPVVLVSVALGSGAYDLLTEADVFAVNLLASDQSAVAQEFARTQSERESIFDQFPWTADSEGVPLLHGALGAFSARVRERISAGDHLLVLGDVHALHRTARQDTLVYHNRGFGQVQRHGVSDAPAK